MDQKTRYSKIEIELGGEYEPGDDIALGHNQLSEQVEQMLNKEKEIIKGNLKIK